MELEPFFYFYASVKTVSHPDMTCAAHAPHAYGFKAVQYKAGAPASAAVLVVTMQQPARRSYLPSTIKPLHLKPRVKTRDDVVWVVFLCCGKGLWRGVGEPALRDLYNALASSSLRHHLFREKRSARLRDKFVAAVRHGSTSETKQVVFTSLVFFSACLTLNRCITRPSTRGRPR